MKAQVRAQRDFSPEQKEAVLDILDEYGEVWIGMFLPFVAFEPDNIRSHASFLKHEAQKLAEAI